MMMEGCQTYRQSTSYPTWMTSSGRLFCPTLRQSIFLITKAVGRLWSRVLRSEDLERDLINLKSHNPASYGSRVRERFLAQFNGASALTIPEGYSFRKEDQPLLPNLMQRLLAYRLAVDKRVGYWS